MDIKTFLTENINSKIFRKSIFPIVFGTIIGGTAFLIFLKSFKSSKHVESKLSKGSFPINELPPETRHKIWRKLDYTDLLTLRLVSPLTKHDIDNCIGLKIVISSRKPGKFQFCQKIVLESCLITDLMDEIDYEFFVQPLTLRNLEIIEKTSIFPTNIKFLLEPCRNLTSLKLHFTHSSQVTFISETVLNAMTRMSNLKQLKIHRCATHVIEEKTFHQEKDSSMNYFHTPRYLISFEVSIPDVSSEQVQKWKFVLERQTQLKTLIVNFGAIHWQFFTKVLSQNHELEKVGIYGLKSYCLRTKEYIPLDWDIFSHLKNLRSFEAVSPRTLGLNGEDLAPSRNFQRFPCEKIERFNLNRIIMSPADVDRIYNDMAFLTEGSLQNIGDAGIIHATELNWTLQERFGNLEHWIQEGRDDSFFNGIVQCVIGLSMLGIVLLVSQNQQFIEPEEDDEDFRIVR